MSKIDKKYIVFILYIIFHNLVLYNFSADNYSNYKSILIQGSQIEKLSGFSSTLIEKDIYPVKMINNELVMEDGISLQFGRKMHGYLLYYSYLISFGKIKNTLLPLNFFFTVVTLVLLFVSLSKKFDFIFAAMTTFFIQSHPWLNYEMYVNANINAYIFVLNIFLISIFFLIQEKKLKKLIIYYILLSILCSFFYNIRELALLCFFQLMISIFFLRDVLKNKFLLTLVTIFIFIISNFSANIFFEIKKNKAESFVEKNGGKVFDLDYYVKHGKWISFHMSLNEFDKKIGTGFWDDKNTFSLIYEKLNLNKKSKHFENIDLESSFKQDTLLFEKSKNNYFIHPHVYKEAEQILKEDVFNKISNNFLLLPKLFIKRIAYNIQNLTPITINLFNYNFHFFKHK